MVGLLDQSSKFLLSKLIRFFKRSENRNKMHSFYHFRKVKKLGLSTLKNKIYKNSSFEDLLKYNFVPSIKEKDSYEYIFSNYYKINAHYLVFINGYFYPLLSNKNNSFCQVKVKEIQNQFIYYPIKSEFFLHLIESLSNQTFNIIISEQDENLSKPIYLIHLNKENKKKEEINIVNYRHNIKIEQGTKIKIIEHFVSLTDKCCFNGSRTIINIGNNVHLNYTKLVSLNNRSYYFGHDDLIIENNSTVFNNTFSFKNKFMQHQNSVQFLGKKSNLSMNSLLLTSNSEKNYISSFVEHKDGYCKSKQLHRIISFKDGKGAFQGLIKVNKNSIKTNSKMINNNLLIGKKSKIISDPKLEIYTDDVICTHGTTFGQIDTEHIFYLQSRGICKEEARFMIINAFSKKIIRYIDHDQIIKKLSKSIKKYLYENLS